MYWGNVSYKRLYFSKACTKVMLTGLLSEQGIVVQERCHTLHCFLPQHCHDYPHQSLVHWVNEAGLSNVFGGNFSLHFKTTLCMPYIKMNSFFYHILYDLNISITAKSNFGCNRSIWDSLRWQVGCWKGTDKSDLGIPCRLPVANATCDTTAV